ncbi:hypothetical protein GLOIN_2v1784566 [Rhizophagus irregularis DAOM 181602=DAOM 197198]|uniref:CCHC-type domain-containing protein n=1 Tax=Rhizophagus irregularis (strain DAOM 181602 / DAOM 197198 / MUCL 43194) TaxID=747089 RepID=A0A2P4PCF7_RHIID|nr:hypothetical protein GLOIN_2v1784566 [Rhizophagus irregularis DAOM 181602=DAOM 197198]POG63074.1 hypothetical protein GLOIN_2v1784566 [Rhizophagus irregularis DAOM 181602=DAOM 197198]|eukprot:XP_025169940.1 hypothetical protein GLOIN_2v1784566 [Rhizophagus irregularis DAOM 181602=DAOM 197198]
MDEESRHESPNNVICSGQPILFNEHDTVSLYSGKTFTSWEECEQFLNEWAKSQEPFLVADKFIQNDQQHFSYDFNDSSSLCLFNRNNREIDEERLTILEQKITYGKLHRMYKKALNKALQSNSKSEQLINLLQNFAEEEESNPSDSDELELQQEIITGTKRFKSSCEANKTKSKTQRHCKRCGLAGHYQKNCKEEAVNN